MPVEYDQENQYRQNATPQEKESFFTYLVLKSGLAKDAKGSQRVLIIVALIFFSLSLYFFFR